MLFIVTYKTSLLTQRDGQERFKETGGASPPAGVQKIASYHYVDGSGGFTIAETNDAIALGKWANQWADVIVMDVRPVLTDEQMGQVLSQPT
jgi:Protein of unknown function (DUF3303)